MVNLGSAAANRLLFWLFLATYVGLMFRFSPRVYAHGFVATYLVALLFASAGMFTLVARVWEGRLPWPLSSQYASAWANDLFVLPLMAGTLSILYRSLPSTYHESAWWPYVAAAIAIGAGFGFQFVIDAGYPSDVAWSPTHAFHSFGSVVVFVYFLLRGMPGFLFGTKGLRAFAHGDQVGMMLCMVVILGFVAFFAMFPVVDVRLLRTYPWGAHGPYDWRVPHLRHRLTPSNPGWMPDNMRANATLYRWR